MSTRIKCCIIGIPDHQGVIHVGGRIGASRGPTAFRRVFKNFKNKDGIEGQVDDVGDVPGLSADVEKNHLAAAEFISTQHASYSTSIVVGGGHDHGYSHLLGISKSLASPSFKKNSRNHKRAARLACINIDAHLDVRQPAPLITSGSPFYLAIETGILDPQYFLEFGIQSHCNGKDLWKYVEKRKVDVVSLRSLRRNRAVEIFSKKLAALSKKADFIVVSFDLDALSAADCPGVSAPQAEGLSSSEIIEIMEICGKNKKIISLGIFELNPEHDRDDQTARVAATAAFHFLESRLTESRF